MALFIAFCALNYRVYDGFFQDDELDTLSWAPLLGWRDYVPALLKPTFDVANFRPAGHFYFTLAGKAFGLDYPPYVTPILGIHLLNVLLLWLVLRTSVAGLLLLCWRLTRRRVALLRGC